MPNTMPFRARANLMVQRGEARDFYEACSLMAKRRSRPLKPKPMAQVSTYRLPYKED